MPDQQTTPSQIIIQNKTSWFIQFFQAISIFFESCSLSGAIICFLALFILIGLNMQWSGNAAGEKVWSYFGSAFTAFMTGKSLGSSETLKNLTNKNS